MYKDNKKDGFLDFPKIPNSALKEVFQKDRKYDSVVEEHRRIFQHGKSIKILFSKKLKDLLQNLLIEAFKETKFVVKKSDFFLNNILYVYDKKQKPIQRIKISKYQTDEKKSIFQMQAITKAGEIRTTITVKRAFLNAKNKVVIYFEQLFKREKTFWGIQDEIRKRAIKNQINYRAALLFKKSYQKKLFISNLPNWVERTLRKFQNKKHTSI